jgi:hypothetical protein
LFSIHHSCLVLPAILAAMGQFVTANAKCDEVFI